MTSSAAAFSVKFKRRYIRAEALPAPSAQETTKANRTVNAEEVNVLVVNDSHDMAKEITMQLTLALPGCSITYAPTIELAKWILNRRKISLVVSSPVLADGGIGRLRDSLKKLASPPDVVVVGDMHIKSAEIFEESGYEFAVLKRIGAARSNAPVIKRSRLTPSLNESTTPRVDTRIKELGADIRNDLNNPLQEIVAMVFVAQAGGELAQPTSQALEAIDRAAKNMAQVVSKLEDKILGAVK